MSWIKFTAHYTEKRSPISREKQTQKTKIKYIKRQAVKNEFLLIKDRKLNFFFHSFSGFNRFSGKIYEDLDCNTTLLSCKFIRFFPILNRRWSNRILD